MRRRTYDRLAASMAFAVVTGLGILLLTFGLYVCTMLMPDLQAPLAGALAVTTLIGVVLIIGALAVMFITEIVTEFIRFRRDR